MRPLGWLDSGMARVAFRILLVPVPALYRRPTRGALRFLTDLRRVVLDDDDVFLGRPMYHNTRLDVGCVTQWPR